MLPSLLLANNREAGNLGEGVSSPKSHVLRKVRRLYNTRWYIFIFRNEEIDSAIMKMLKPPLMRMVHRPVRWILCKRLVADASVSCSSFAPFWTRVRTIATRSRLPLRCLPHTHGEQFTAQITQAIQTGSVKEPILLSKPCTRLIRLHFRLSVETLGKLSSI